MTDPHDPRVFRRWQKMLNGVVVAVIELIASETPPNSDGYTYVELI